MADAPAPPPSGEHTATDVALTHPGLPPWPWLLRAIALFWLVYFVFDAASGLLSALRSLFVILLVSLFLSLALEPAVDWLARRGWRRGSATGLAIVVLLVATAGFGVVMGSLVVNQVSDFVDEAPQYLQDIEDWVNDRFDADLEFDDVIADLEDPDGAARQFAEDLAGNALAFSVAAIGVLFQMLSVLLFTFYLVADGPRLRRTICSVLPAHQQRRVLWAWEIAIQKTGSYLYSRLVLATFSAGATMLVLGIIGVPYYVALALWVGIISQFIPVVGTYLAGGLAVLVALLNDPVDGVLTLVFIVVYQQIENYVFAPRVTAHTLQLHPAIGFAAVVVGGSVLGPVGALLAVPIAAVLQAFISTFGERHEVVDSDLTQEVPAPRARRSWLPWRRDGGDD
ncbi:MAG TPA: AI-2E family transporter [Acidimicrobiia bacterium]|nr:AI-2E family transporter [Acidimicrobiia bacterium]